MPGLNYKSKYYCLQTNQGPLHVHIDYTDKGPQHIFVNIPPHGTERSVFAALTGILVSKCMQAGISLVEIINNLKSIRGSTLLCRYKGEAIMSIPQALAIILLDYTNFFHQEISHEDKTAISNTNL